jgi:hypothetical protein
MSNTIQTENDGKFLYDMLKRRYGERLSPEELEEVKKGVENIRKAADKLRSVNLQNSDGPPALFVPYRKDS